MKLILILLVGFSFWFSYRILYTIGENYFFDKLFYYKSVAHGYWVPKQNIILKDFGKRAEDIFDFKVYLQQKLRNPEINFSQKTNESSKYTILFIGDSFLWGQGLREEQRMISILYSKLNKIRPTRIISLAYSGDNLLDNYIKYIHAKQYYQHIDTVIFGLVDNDLLLRKKIPDDRYDGSLSESITASCSGSIVYDIENESERESEKDPFKFWQDKLESSIQPNTKNYCVFLKLLSILPKQSTIYFDFVIQKSDSSFSILQKITQEFTNRQYFVMSSSQKYISNPNQYSLLPFKSDKYKFIISPREHHPSALANRLYAESIYEELTTDKKWKFIN